VLFFLYEILAISHQPLPNNFGLDSKRKSLALGGVDLIVV